MQTMLETGEHASPALEWYSCRVTLDQAWERRAKRHNIEQLLRSSAHALEIKATLDD